MRSDQIHQALSQGMNRFEVCQLVAKGVKATHKTGGRFEDSGGGSFWSDKSGAQRPLRDAIDCAPQRQQYDRSHSAPPAGTRVARNHR